MTGTPVETMPLNPGFKDRRKGGRIIKSADAPMEKEVRPHLFPQLSGTSPPAEGLPLDQTPEFKPEAFPSAETEIVQPLRHPGPDAHDPENQTRSSYDDTADLNRLLTHVQQAILAMETIARRTDQEVEYAIGRLALHLAALMVNNAASINPDLVLNNLAKALQRVQGHDIRRVRLNPADIDAVAASKKMPPGMMGHFKDLQLEMDPAIDRGSCLIETKFGVVDATYENQFRLLLENFHSVVGVDLPA